MDIKELIAQVHAENDGVEPVVGTGPVVETPVVDVPKEAPLPVEPVVERVPVPVEKPKRGRKPVYKVDDLEVGDYIVYKRSLASGRVLASLKGKGKYKKFHAFVDETTQEVRISRKV